MTRPGIAGCGSSSLLGIWSEDRRFCDAKNTIICRKLLLNSHNTNRRVFNKIKMSFYLVLPTLPFPLFISDKERYKLWVKQPISDCIMAWIQHQYLQLLFSIFLFKKGDITIRKKKSKQNQNLVLNYRYKHVIKQDLVLLLSVLQHSVLCHCHLVIKVI